MSAPLPDLRAGHYWKTPFIWQPGQTVDQPKLRFEPCDEAWLPDATAAVMAQSEDRADQFAVGQLGAVRAAHELLQVDPHDFQMPRGWWRAALNDEGHRVGFVLPVVFSGGQTRRGGSPEATIYYMGVLPPFRGRGYAVQLLLEAVRVCQQSSAWRLYCDTGTDNEPMVRAFRRAGFSELQPHQRAIT